MRVSITGAEVGVVGSATACAHILKYVVAGDVNMDGVVNQTDLNIISGHWQDTNADWVEGDLNGDGIVNQLDLNMVVELWQETLSSTFAVF